MAVQTRTHAPPGGIHKKIESRGFWHGGSGSELSGTGNRRPDRHPPCP